MEKGSISMRCSELKLHKLIGASLAVVLLSVAAAAQDRTGGIKGKVRVETGSPAGVAVVVKQSDREITRVITDRNGDFVVQRLAPGVYGLTFRKAGLSVGTIESVEVKGGKTRSLGDRLFLTVDEGSLAFIRGSVFDSEGRSFPNARVDLARFLEDGSLKKIDSRVTTETGSFGFSRLPPNAAKYRVTARADHMQTASADVEIDGAAIYRI